ncbi:MAG: putative anti-sigma regulatory factor, serine/threonine protein kinase [Nitrospira sp.]|nr:putative anti-sigma regulatory factor, serine/threonine protein kinase [Nitrospira sp.]
MISLAADRQVCVPVTEQSQPAAARRAAVSLAQEAGIDEPTIGNVALVVTELGTNLVKHAQGGVLLIRRFGLEGYEGIEVLSLDKGPGMSNVSRSLEDGYSTAGSPGTGLGAVLRTAGEFDIYSQPGKGTAVVARVKSRQSGSEERHTQAVGAVRQAMPGEAVCGDNWVFCSYADGWLCAVADGLGHGLIAAQAASAIVEAVGRAPANRTPVELVEAAHQAAKPTRGAAVGIAVMDGPKGLVRFAGIGNIAALVVKGTERRHLVSYNGIIGHDYRKLMEFTHPWHAESLLLLHSDGISTHWDLDRYPGLLSRDPSLIAGILYRDFNRGRDDATVVVVKQRASAGLSSSEQRCRTGSV